MSIHQIDDMVQGVRNFIEAAGIQEGDKVLFLGDTRSDPLSIKACTVGLKMIGTKPMIMIMDHLARYSRVPNEAIGAAAHTDVIVLTWPVFITAGLNSVRKARTATSDCDPSTAIPGQPKLVYLECAPGILASSYAHFSKRNFMGYREARSRDRVEGDKNPRNLSPRLGSGLDLRCLQVVCHSDAPVEPGGRCQFPWGRCGIFHGAGRRMV